MMQKHAKRITVALAVTIIILFFAMLLGTVLLSILLQNENVAKRYFLVVFGADIAVLLLLFWMIRRYRQYPFSKKAPETIDLKPAFHSYDTWKNHFVKALQKEGYYRIAESEEGQFTEWSFFQKEPGSFKNDVCLIFHSQIMEESSTVFIHQICAEQVQSFKTQHSGFLRMMIIIGTDRPSDAFDEMMKTEKMAGFDLYCFWSGICFETGKLFFPKQVRAADYRHLKDRFLMMNGEVAL